MELPAIWDTGHIARQTDITIPVHALTTIRPAAGLPLGHDIKKHACHSKGMRSKIRWI